MNVLNVNSIIAASVLLAANTSVSADYSYTEQRHLTDSASVVGVPVTGPNRFCGKLRWSFDDQGITPLSFRQVGAYAPGNDLPNELNQENCAHDQVLATIHDTTISNNSPAIVQVPDVRLQNIPLRDVPKIPGILQGGTTGLRTTLERTPNVPANPFPIYASEPSDDITLGKWASARGRLNYRCRSDGTAAVNARFTNLIENGVYSMWGIWKTALPNGGFADLPVPFGGVPNAIVSNKRGQATFTRELPFCPSQDTEDGSLVLWVALAYHSDSSLYAGVPDAADLRSSFIVENGESFESTLSLMVHHEQVAFPINFTATLTD